MFESINHLLCLFMRYLCNTQYPADIGRVATLILNSHNGLKNQNTFISVFYKLFLSLDTGLSFDPSLTQTASYTVLE